MHTVNNLKQKIIKPKSLCLKKMLHGNLSRFLDVVVVFFVVLFQQLILCLNSLRALQTTSNLFNNLFSIGLQQKIVLFFNNQVVKIQIPRRSYCCFAKNELPNRMKLEMYRKKIRKEVLFST